MSHLFFSQGPKRSTNESCQPIELTDDDVLARFETNDEEPSTLRMAEGRHAVMVPRESEPVSARVDFEQLLALPPLTDERNARIDFEGLFSGPRLLDEQPALSPASADDAWPALPPVVGDTMRPIAAELVPEAETVATARGARRPGLLASIAALGLCAAAAFGALSWSASQSAASAPATLAPPAAETTVASRAASQPAQTAQPSHAEAVAPPALVAPDAAPASAPEKPAPAASPRHTQARAEAPAPLSAPAAGKPASLAEQAAPAAEKPAEPAAPELPAFDKAAARNALRAQGAAALASCPAEPGLSGPVSLSVIFAPSGRATQARVNGAPYAGTATGGCIAAALRRASVPAFSGERVTVSITLSP